MTRKRAIDEAVKANRMPPIAGVSRTPTYDTFGIAGQAYDAGRIAGLREAARMAMDVACARSHSAELAEPALVIDRKIRRLANALAKKARGK